MAKRATSAIMSNDATRGRVVRNTALDRVEAMLSLDPYLTPFENIVTQVQHLSQSERRQLLSLCTRILDDKELRKIEKDRLAAVKTIVALIPESARVIRKWIRRRSSGQIHEVHFSLFCFLDQVPDLPDAGEFADEIPLLIEDYLRQVEVDSARAAWMAGDLLGDHWEVTKTLPILLRVAKGARFAAGRKGALHGLEHALAKVEDSTKKSILTLVHELSEVDRSPKVREYAKLMLRGVVA
jgi:hypothetical protein